MHFPERKGFPEDAQKGGEQDIATKTPTVHSNNPPTLNKFAKQLFLVAFPPPQFQRYSSTIFHPPDSFIFLSLFLFSLNFLERIINAWNFRKSFKSRTNRRQGTLLLSPLTRFTRRNSLEEIFHRFSNARRRTCEWIGNRKRDFRASRSRNETRLVPFVWHAIDKLVIFSADVNFSSFSPSPFLLRSLSVLCTPTRRSRGKRETFIWSIGMMYRLCCWKRVLEEEKKKDRHVCERYNVYFFEEVR